LHFLWDEEKGNSGVGVGVELRKRSVDKRNQKPTSISLMIKTKKFCIFYFRAKEGGGEGDNSVCNRTQCV
jgi:hypothetical protein